MSIIVPVYNTERYIGQCIQSLLGQTLTQIEIVAIHHDSADNSLSELTEAAVNDPHVVILDRNGLSLADARNLGLSMARGEYVGFVDADDYVEPDMFARLYETAMRDHSDIAMCDYNMSYADRENSRVLGLADAAIRVDDLGPERFYLRYIAGSPTVWNKLYRRSLIEGAVLRFEIDDGEDLLFNMRLLPYISKISTVGVGLYHYRIRKNSAMHDNVARYSVSSAHLLTAYLDRPAVRDVSLLPYFAFACTFTGFMFSSHCVNRDRAFFDGQLKALETVPFWKEFCIKMTQTDELAPLYREKAISVRFYQIIRLLCMCSAHGWERAAALLLWLTSKLIRIKKRDLQLGLFE